MQPSRLSIPKEKESNGRHTCNAESRSACFACSVVSMLTLDGCGSSGKAGTTAAGDDDESALKLRKRASAARNSRYGRLTTQLAKGPLPPPVAGCREA